MRFIFSFIERDNNELYHSVVESVMLVKVSGQNQTLHASNGASDSCIEQGSKAEAATGGSIYSLVYSTLRTRHIQRKRPIETQQDEDIVEQKIAMGQGGHSTLRSVLLPRAVSQEERAGASDE